jgi:uncharacterized membrane protein YdbT with pleckstrin-like domain
MKTQLKKEEKVILETRPHWMTMAIPFLIVLATTIVVIAIHHLLFLILIAVGFFLYKMFERNNNIWVVTNLRVIDEYGLFSTNAKESPLDKINNISYSQTFWGKILGYGNVQIQTAAEIGSTTYLMVDHPKKLKDTITNMQEEYKDNLIKRQAKELATSITDAQGGKADVTSELEKLFELKQKGIITEEEFNAGKAKILNS